MLLNKQTHCFNCGSTAWTTSGWRDEEGRSTKHDFCRDCKHGRVHYAYMDAPADRAYFSEYLDENGNPCNFMTNDPRSRR